MEKVGVYEKIRLDRHYEILSVAKQLICEKGFTDSSMKELATRLNISRKTLYKYFENIDDIAYEIQTSLIKKMIDSFQTDEPYQGSGIDKLKNSLIAFFDYMNVNTSDILFISLFDIQYNLRSINVEKQKEYQREISSHISNSPWVYPIVLDTQVDDTIRKDIDKNSCKIFIYNTMLAVVQRLAVIGNSSISISQEDRQSTQNILIEMIVYYFAKK